MPRKTDITLEEVRAACQQISAQGKPVTWSAVRAILGRGSFPVVSKHIEVWRREVSVEERYPDLPSDLVDAVRRLIQGAHEAGRAAALRDLAAEYQQLEDERASNAAKLADAERQLQDARLAASEAQHTVSVLNLRIATLEESLDRAAQEKTQMDRMNAGLLADQARLVDSVQELKQQLEGAQRQLDQANKDHEAEQARAEQRYRGLETSLLQRHDLEKQPLRDKVAELTQKLNESTTMGETMRQQVNAKLAELAEKKGRLESMHQQLTESRGRALDLESQLKLAMQRADRAEGALSALQERAR